MIFRIFMLTIWAGLILSALADGRPGDIWGISIAVGVVCFVWYAAVDAGKKVRNAIPPSEQTHVHLTQNRFDLTESDDPTRPNENIPAVIEIGRHYKSKP